MLVNNAVTVTPTGGAVRIRTSHDANCVRLQIEDGGPPVAPEKLIRLFEPSGSNREGVNPLELAACQNLARRLRAVMRAEAHAAGVRLVVEFSIV